MPLPNLIVIGGMKCGTTSLHAYLRQHPQIAMSKQKALDFFIDGGHGNWHRGVDWYARQFAAGTPVRGEASPNYTNLRRHPELPARMHAVVPDATLVFMVRDPIDRLVSHWIHNVDNGRERRPLAEAIRDERYVDRSRYGRQLEAFLHHYPAERIRVLSAGELATARRETLRGLFELLGVRAEFDSGAFDREHNRSSSKRRKTAGGERLAASPVGRAIERLPPRWRAPVRLAVYRPLSRRVEAPVLDAADREWLSARLGPDIERLRQLTGRRFEDWSL